jgi:hypothetical protein
VISISFDSFIQALNPLRISLIWRFASPWAFRDASLQVRLILVRLRFLLLICLVAIVDMGSGERNSWEGFLLLGAKAVWSIWFTASYAVKKWNHRETIDGCRKEEIALSECFPLLSYRWRSRCVRTAVGNRVEDRLSLRALVHKRFLSHQRSLKMCSPFAVR